MELLTAPVENPQITNFSKSKEEVVFNQGVVTTFYDNRSRFVDSSTVELKFYTRQIRQFEGFLIQNRGKTFIWDYDKKHYYCPNYSVEVLQADASEIIGNINISLVRDTNYV